MSRIIRKPYDDRISVRTMFEGETRTKQSFKAECDINGIMKKFARTRLLTHVAAHQGRYEYLPSGLDYQEALNTLKRAELAFQSLPAAVRTRFDNDPAAFLAFAQDERNQAELVKMGLGRVDSPPGELKPAEPAATAAPATEGK